MFYYHYTSAHHIQQIIHDGFIKTTESNVSPHEYGVGPDVVWLFKKPITSVSVPNMLRSVGHYAANQSQVPVDKSKIYIKVNLEPTEVQRADKFFKKHNAESWWIKRLEDMGGGTKSKDWYVIERDVPSSEWEVIGDRYNSTQIIHIGQK